MTAALRIIKWQVQTSKHVYPVLSQSNIRKLSMKDTRQFEDQNHTKLYAIYRPQPPSTIIDHIQQFRGSGDPGKLAIDIGCGSGQFTSLLTNQFEKVLATDVSKEQVNQAREKLSSYPNVQVEVGSGEDIVNVDDGSVDLVSVCQALHWMDLSKFYSEVSRVLVGGGVLAVIGYHFSSPAPSVPGADQVGINPRPSKVSSQSTI